MDSKTHLTALRRLLRSLDDWRDYEQSEDWLEYFPEEILRDDAHDGPHPVWTAVVEVQRFYRKNRLPHEVISAWARLCKYSRGNGKEDQVTQRDLAVANSEILREWVLGEIRRLSERAADHTGSDVKPPPGNLAQRSDDGRATANADALQIEAGADQRDWLQKLRDQKPAIIELMSGNGHIRATEPESPVTKIERFQPFPTDALPEPIRGFVVAGAKAIGCDSSYLALPMLAAFAAAIGHTRRLRLKRTWTVSATLWAAVIGESGDKKSPRMELALKPFERREFEAGDQHEGEIEQYERQVAEWKKQYKAWEHDKKTEEPPPEKPRAPVAHRYLIDDVTIEGVTPILQDNPRGVLDYKDELKSWFGSFDRYVTRKGGDDAFWLKVFNNKLIVVDRKTSGTIRVQRPFICIIGGIQPGTLRRVLGIEHLESGMAARLLLAWPPSRPRKWTDAELPEPIEGAFTNVIERLFTLQPELEANERPCPRLVVPTEAARALFIDYYNRHADEMAELKSAWAKLEEFAARLALVIHYARWAADDPTLLDPEKVDEASMKAGITLTEWFKNEARRVYAMLSETDEDRDQRRLVEWIERRGTRVEGQGLAVTAREAQQGCRWLPTGEDAEMALENLVKAGYGHWQPSPPGQRGKPTRRFILVSVYGNPFNPEENGNTADVDGVTTKTQVEDDDWGNCEFGPVDEGSRSVRHPTRGSGGPVEIPPPVSG